MFSPRSKSHIPIYICSWISLRSGKSALRRPFSSVSIDGLTTEGSGDRVKRVKVLSQDQRAAIQTLTSASQIPHAERKRQWGALARRLEKPCPAGVLAKWEAATTASAKLGAHSFSNENSTSQLIPYLRFEFLKCFMLDETLNNVTVETWHKESGPQILYTCCLSLFQVLTWSKGIDTCQQDEIHWAPTGWTWSSLWPEMACWESCFLFGTQSDWLYAPLLSFFNIILQPFFDLRPKRQTTSTGPVLSQLHRTAIFST